MSNIDIEGHLTKILYFLIGMYYDVIMDIDSGKMTKDALRKMANDRKEVYKSINELQIAGFNISDIVDKVYPELKYIYKIISEDMVEHVLEYLVEKEECSLKKLNIEYS